MTQHSMLDQPKTSWVCACGAKLYEILLCPKCKGSDTHVIGFQCIACKIIYTTIPDNPDTYEENENTFH